MRTCEGRLSVGDMSGAVKKTEHGFSPAQWILKSRSSLKNRVRIHASRSPMPHSPTPLSPPTPVIPEGLTWQCKCRCQSAPARLAQSRRHHPGPTLLSLLPLGPSQQNHFSAMSGWHGVWQRLPTNIASGGTAGPQAPLLSRCWFWNICHESGSFLQALKDRETTVRLWVQNLPLMGTSEEEVCP